MKTLVYTIYYQPFKFLTNKIQYRGILNREKLFFQGGIIRSIRDYLIFYNLIYINQVRYVTNLRICHIVNVIIFMTLLKLKYKRTTNLIWKIVNPKENKKLKKF